jgi:PIN domain nuclease of toxin-antitoxin system
MRQIEALDDRPTYVVDTHAFYWYLQNPGKLSPAADAVFRLAEAGGATMVVPAIVVAELFYVAKKHNHNLSLSRLLDDIDETAGYVLSPLAREQLAELDELHEVSEMHDRLIAAEALARAAIVVSRDPILAACSSVTTVW